jgi:ABC-type antimicrobial peptide transport system permease subunit
VTDPVEVIARVRQVIAEVDPQVPMFAVRMQVDAVNDQVVTERLFATLCGGFGVVGLALAVIGLYGVLSYAVTRRTREIGIRVALGAERRRIVWTVAREALELLAIGVLVGLPAALALARLVESKLYGLKPNDPATVAGAVAVLLVAALAAGLVPARAATRIEPVTALRHE